MLLKTSKQHKFITNISYIYSIYSKFHKILKKKIRKKLFFPLIILKVKFIEHQNPKNKIIMIDNLLI